MMVVLRLRNSDLEIFEKCRVDIMLFDLKKNGSWQIEFKLKQKDGSILLSAYYMLYADWRLIYFYAFIFRTIQWI